MSSSPKSPDATSAMRATMNGQATALAELASDRDGLEAVAARLSDRRVLLIGTGTSWHAAEQGARLLRLSGTDALAAQSADVAVEDRLLDRRDVVVALTHTGTKRFTAEVVEGARERSLDVIQISATGVAGADLHTVTPEHSAAYTASHLGALLRLAQLADALGAKLGPLEAIPSAVEAALAAEQPRFPPPDRLIEFIGAGINQWTAAEGALKIREAAYVASEGLSVEQFLHGPSVALRANDRLVCLDGGGPASERIREVAGAAEHSGVPVTVVADHQLPEPLSIFPLTVAVQRIALQSAEALGVNPDSFGRDVPGREPWSTIEL